MAGVAEQPKQAKRHRRPKLSAVRPLRPILVDADGAAALVGISRAQWFKMDSAGQTPAAIRLAERCVRWQVSELRAWCQAGCPPREDWEIKKAAAARKAEAAR